MKTLDLHEAAAFLRMHPETLRQRDVSRLKEIKLLNDILELQERARELERPE